MVDAKNLGSPFGMKTATTVWMGQHQKFDFILNDLNFEKNRLCTGLQIIFRALVLFWMTLKAILAFRIVSTCGQPRMIHELVRDPQDMDHKLSNLDMMRNLAIKFEKGFVTAKKAMSSNQALLGRNSGSSDSTSKLTLADREDNDSLRHQFNLIKSPTEKESFRRYIFLIHFDWSKSLIKLKLNKAILSSGIRPSSWPFFRNRFKKLWLGEKGRRSDNCWKSAQTSHVFFMLIILNSLKYAWNLRKSM